MKPRLFLRSLFCVLALLFTILLPACGTKDVTGDYMATVTFAKLLSEAELAQVAAMDAENGMGFITDATLTMTLSLRDDKSYEIGIDSEAFFASVREEFEKNKDALVVKMLTSQGYDENDLEAAASDLGYGSYEEFRDAAVELLRENVEAYMDAWTPLLSDATTGDSYSLKGSSILFDGMNADRSGVEATVTEDGSIAVSYAYSDDVFLELRFTKESGV